MAKKQKLSLRKLSLSEAARALGIAPNTLRTLSDMGRINCDRSYLGHRVYDPVVIAAEKQRRALKRKVMRGCK
jgi:DNA-binding transcriptional MerR regulator